MKLFPLRAVLTTDDILRIHDVLVRDFASAGDPLSPPGVRSHHLLASAISRQDTGLGKTLKYPDAVGNASSLMYGLCADHPFHNGNKRTALVAMLVHLDKNKLMLDQATQSELYQLLVDVAGHTLVKDAKKATGADADLEVAAIAKWLGKRVRARTSGERLVTYRQLRRLLGNHGFELYEPLNNSIKVGRYVTRTVGLLRRREVRELQHIWTIGYPGEGAEVGIGPIKDLRRRCRLTEDDGFDSSAFYDDEAVVDAFVVRYSKTLKRLAKR